MKIDTIKDRINSIRIAHPMYDELLTFFGKIVTKQYEFKQQMQMETSILDIEAGRAQKKIEAGIPIFEDEEFDIDIASTWQLFDALCDIATSQNELLRDEIERIDKTVRKGLNLESPAFVGLREELFQQVAHNGLDYINEISNAFSLNKDILTLLTINSVKPSIELTAHWLQHLVNIESWSGIRCPMCGSSPAISCLRGEEGRRVLFCSFCSTEWQGIRMMCYHCENTDYQTLRYFYTQEEEKYRIDVCDQCKHYLKTLEERKFDEEIVPSVEHIATLHLDILAAKEGYRNPER